MSVNSFGRLLRVTTWGESHGPAIGGVIDGCPAGLELDLDRIQQELDRRRPGSTPVGTLLGQEAVASSRIPIKYEVFTEENLRAILERGSAVVSGPDGSAVTDAGRLSTGAPVTIRLARGSAAAEVTETRTDDGGGAG
mgnify:CR=1 FL=1